MYIHIYIIYIYIFHIYMFLYMYEIDPPKFTDESILHTSMQVRRWANPEFRPKTAAFVQDG